MNISTLFMLLTLKTKIKFAVLIVLFLYFLTLASQPVFAAATITIVNGDAAAEGLNDSSAFTATAGNSANTLGQARLNAMQQAANILGSIITSTVEIKIYTQFNPLGGSSSSATLAGASTTSYVRDFTNAPVSATWYPLALAEKISGADITIAGETNEINVTVNSDVDGTTVLGTTTWYYGFDSVPGTDLDFITVIMHEILHGLGFASTVNVSTGVKLADLFGTKYNGAFMRLLEHHGATTVDYPSMTDAQRLSASKSDTLLHWLGTNVVANTGSVTAGKSASEIQMYAPTTTAVGSSVSHFNTTVTPNEMMEPSYTVADHNIGLAAYLLQDLGWGAANINSTSIDIQVTQSGSAASLTAGDNETYSIVVSNNSGSSATEVVVTDMIPAGASYVSGTHTGSGTGLCTQANNVVTCQIGDLTSATPVNVTIVAKLNSSGTNTNTIFVDSVNPDSSISNNANSLISTVAAAPVQAPAGGTKSCFIATAAYGSPMQADVRYLRAFRDQYLLTNRPGKWLVKMYYRHSPTLANWIKDSAVLRSVVRGLLSPLVTLSRKTVTKDYLDLQN